MTIQNMNYKAVPFMIEEIENSFERYRDYIGEPLTREEVKEILFFFHEEITRNTIGYNGQ